MANGLGFDSGYGKPLSASFAGAVQTASGLGRMQDEQRARARAQQMQALWQQSGGDLAKFEAAGGFQFLSPQLVNQLKTQQAAKAEEQRRYEAEQAAAKQAQMDKTAANRAFAESLQPPPQDLSPTVENAAQLPQQEAVFSALQAGVKPGEFLDEAGNKPTTEFQWALRERERLRGLTNPTQTEKDNLESLEGLLDKKTNTSKQLDKEADIASRKAAVPFLDNMPPADRYRAGWRVKDDGSLYLGADNAPEKLKDPQEALGKRTNISLIMELGELRDDAEEVLSLVENPQIRSTLKATWGDGRFLDMAENEFGKWLASLGLAADDPAGEVLWRIHRMASAERKKFLGVAITPTELKSIVLWLPDAGDNLEQMTQKLNLVARESDEQMYRWLDVWKNIANMSSFYDAFGLDRFNRKAIGKSLVDEGPKPQRFKILSVD